MNGLNERGMPKPRLRFDPKTGDWRHGRYQKVKRCCDCGKVSIIGNSHGRCGNCVTKRYYALLASPYGVARSRGAAAVAKAIKKGLLPKLDGSIQCADCTQPARVYDHRDYSAPLKVEPVCQRCNALRGPSLGFKEALAS